MHMLLQYLGYGAAILAIAGLAWWWATSGGQGITNVVPKEPAPSALAADVYPLYAGAEWGAVEEMGDGTASVASKPITDITDIAELSTPFTEYYDQKLTAAGWKHDMLHEASGPGSNVSYYTKGDRFITIAFTSDFKVQHEDMPSECPCDITFTVASGKNQ